MYDAYVFVEEMKEFKGKYVTIRSASLDHYKIIEDDERWLWTDAMLEDIEEKETSLEEQIGEIVDIVANTIKENPGICLKLGRVIGEKDKEIEGLKLKIKKLEAINTYYKGKISVYEDFIKD